MYVELDGLSEDVFSVILNFYSEFLWSQTLLSLLEAVVWKKWVKVLIKGVNYFPYKGELLKGNSINCL